MMKIGILTFHWGTNYGAILQAYALQTYLKRLGHEVFIINYQPKRYRKTLIKCFFTPRFYLYPMRVKDYFKELKLRKFRNKQLNQSGVYNSLQELKDNPPAYDVYICGSDQIWNPSFTTLGERKPTSSYFLDFGAKSVKRIAYAVSFGHDKLPLEAFNIAKQYVPFFNAISVRETTGLEIVTQLGYSSPVLLPDPTLLLTASDYSFTKSGSHREKAVAFIYMLRGDDKNLKNIYRNLSEDYLLKSATRIINHLTVEEWVSSIRNAQLVLTNSFHGMVFSILFHVPFVVILPNGSAKSMNDRFYTLLSGLKLEERMVYVDEQMKIDKLLNSSIDWLYVDKKINELRNKTAEFFDVHLKSFQV